ncbi:MAG: YiiX/YebB-like N1pC/P60 family cysteine hydrolase [Desulfosarcinaceae bacterium]
MAQLDDLRATHGHWFEIKTNSVRSRFLFREYALFLTGYRYAMEFIALSDHNPAVDVLLNEAVPELGLEAGRYKSFKFHFLNVARATEFAAFEVIYKLEKPLPGLFADVIQADREVIWRMGRGQGAALTAKNAISIVKDSLQQAWFPVQKRAATWMGETRVLRGDSALISSEQVAGLQPRLQPGDILLERREWYMSNLGLPGFWTHVALYVGTADERRDYFKGADVEAWLKTRQPAAASLEDLLAVRYPEACRKSSGLQDGHPMRIVEAVSEGVVFTTLEHSAAADSLAVLRPRLSRGEKARAIERAFHYSGRPYDYNFDFQTDMALVCSELVYKAYEPSRTATGLKFELTQVMGRWLLPPNEIARMFDAEADLTGRQTDLVVFLDGYESLQQAVEADTRAFRLSWKRPKWHIILQHAETATSKAE